jgi:Ni/Fe-hydrogenase subunit HybB-like protein
VIRERIEPGVPGLRRPAPYFLPGQTYASIDKTIGDIVLKRPITVGWLALVGVSGAFTALFTAEIAYLFLRGVGVWGVNIPVAWGFAIANFVWWVGIGHAGTLISAILLLLRQEWRTSINRFAEAMTLFAVACAGLMPILHLGRPWVFYWLLPYPNTMILWPQFRSPLIWDAFAVGTYLIVSVIFWYQGLIPDAAAVRDRAPDPLRRAIFGIISMGWRGDAIHWKYYETGYYLLAALATPLVVSVHSIVSIDFAAAQTPGWHSTIFPPYFVAGAILSGFVMVLTLSIPLRKYYHLEAYITPRHLENMAKVCILTSLIVAYGYCEETLMAWYSGDRYEQYMIYNRAFGAYGFAYWGLLFCNVLVPQTLWYRPLRLNLTYLWILSLVVQVGMWTERFVIVVQSLHRDFMPSIWHMYVPTFWDAAILFGSIGFFFFLFMLFLRSLPMVPTSEVQELAMKKEGASEAAGE